MSARPGYDWSAFWPGALGVFSLGGFILGISFLGLGALARGMGFDLWPALVSTILIWALPGQVVLLTLAHEGAALATIALTVSFTAIRLFPMVTMVLSKLVIPGAARWPLFIMAHYIAATLWVLAGANAYDMPRAQRLPWLMGLGICMMSVMLCMSSAGYYLTGALPLIVAAAMAFLSPCFFFVILFSNSKAPMDLFSIAGGVLLVPVFMHIAPDYDLVLAGLIGGSAAYLIGRRF